MKHVFFFTLVLQFFFTHFTYTDAQIELSFSNKNNSFGHFQHSQKKTLTRIKYFSKNNLQTFYRTFRIVTILISFIINLV